MAHSLSAKKRIRQALKHRARNRWRKDSLKKALKTFDEAIRGGKIDDAGKQLPSLYKVLDQTAAKGTIHKNVASRKKSRLTAQLRKARPAAATV